MLPSFAHLLAQSVLVDTLTGGVIAAIVAAGAGYITSSISLAKFEGTVTATISGHGERLNSLDNEQADQWKKIGDVDKEIAVVKATMHRPK